MRTVGLKARIGSLFIAAGMLASCSSGPTPATYDLSAASVRSGGALHGQLVVPRPDAVQALSGENIIVKDNQGGLSFVGGGQWADQLPNLVQTRLIHTFENSSDLRRVSRPGTGVIANYALATEIRSFYIDAASGNAVVEISARLIAERSGSVLRAKIFSAQSPASPGDAGSAARGLDLALSEVMSDIVRWTTGARR